MKEISLIFVNHKIDQHYIRAQSDIGYDEIDQNYERDQSDIC